MAVDMTKFKKRKILVIVEAANPEWASVPLIGWSLARALQNIHDVHIVTQIRNRDAFLRAGLVEGRDFTAIDSEFLAAPMWRLGKLLRLGEGKGWTMMQAVSALSYPYFERLVWRQFGARIKAGEFDVVHRITPLSPTANSSLSARCKRAGVPFVMGPLNGGVPWPKGFNAERLREREWLSYLRNAYKLFPARRASLKSAAAILLGSRHTQSEMPEAVQNKCIYMPENGIDPTRFFKQADHKSSTLKACFVGRLVAYKGADMLLEAALPLLQSKAMTLDIVGDGPMMVELQGFVQKHELTDQVSLHGWLEHSQVQDVLSHCNVLSFPSVREFGGGVVLEAMALGVPALIVDYAGPSELVDDAVGYKVPLGTRAQIVTQFRAALTDLSQDVEGLKVKGLEGRKRIADKYTWDAKARQISAVYEWVLGQAPKPDFFDNSVKQGDDHVA